MIFLKPARLAPRIGAALIDFIFINIACTVASLPLLKFFNFQDMMVLMKDFAISQASGADFNFDPETVSRIMGFLLVCLVLMLVLMLIVHGYYIYFECTSGQTPGKKILGLRVVDLHGGKITKAQALTREMFRWYLDALLVPLTLISIYSTVRRQRVGDIVAKTLVVEIEKTPSNTTTF